MPMLAYLVPIISVILIHGAGHALAAACAGVRFDRLRVTATGFRLLTPSGFPSYRAEALTAIGGPLFNIVSALIVAHACPSSELFVPLSLYLGALNLLPIRGFDGASILTCLLCSHHPPIPSCLPHVAERVIGALSVLTLFAFWMISIYLLLRRGSALSLYVFCLQLFRTIFVEQHDAKRADS